MSSSEDETVAFTPRPDPPEPSGQAFHARRWRRHKALALTLGALGGGLAGWANSAYGLPLAAIDPDLFLAAVAVLIAPVVEEHVKLLTLLLLRAEEKAAYTPRRWLVLGAFAGAGFGLAEAIYYWQAIAPLSTDLAALNLATRLLLTVPFHALTVAATGYGYGLFRHRGTAKPLVGALAVAITAHALFNGLQLARTLGVAG